ncbi:MAG TPA: PQQ-dependent sugar dehydrogenase [Vicinamibacterales bacterium]|nr:PQQ-dependent sugar dehydrogenase [Vicinamibacterales bacterium]
MQRRRWIGSACLAASFAAALTLSHETRTSAQLAAPELLDRNLRVRTVVSGLNLPIGVAFLGPSDMLVLEKDTGLVKRIVNGAVVATVLDLGVNRNSERGLLSIALHPDFPTDPGVYLYWTCRSTAPPADPFFPDELRCLDANMFLPDSGNVLEVPLLGNRVDRFVWDGSSLTYDRNVIVLRAFQNDGAPTPPGQGDETQPPRGNHDGGVIRFGPDGKLYVVIGDTGRRGQMQNLPDGPGGPTRADDQFGGPEPDDAHLTGVILRLNDDGSAPADNPFFAAGAAMGGEAGANVQKIYAYGLRNSFGMAFDPESGALWEQENGDDTFSEINRVEPGFNSGWVQVMGPPSRIEQFKTIETTVTPSPPDPFAGTYFGLQQLRWSPVNIADSAEEAMSRLFMLPGAHYSAPEFAWKFEVAPGGIGFVRGRALGPQYRGDLFVAAARPFLEGGHLFRLQLTGNRRKIAVDDPRLEDRVADNLHKWEGTESESLLVGRNFGVGTDVQTGPNGNLYIVSLSNGAIYEISRRR